MPLIAPESLVCLVYVIVACVVGFLGLPLYFGKIPPNRFYGFRTERTLADPKVWYPVNRVAGGWMAVTGALTAAVATWVQRNGWKLESAAVANLIVFSAGMFLMLIHSLRTLWRIK
jgi:uncharacterized membrane protein